MGADQSSPDTERLRQVLGAFYKTVDVMKSARNSDSKNMNVWTDDMKAVEDVVLFLENLRDDRPATPAGGEAKERVMGILDPDVLQLPKINLYKDRWDDAAAKADAILAAVQPAQCSAGSAIAALNEILRECDEAPTDNNAWVVAIQNIARTALQSPGAAQPSAENVELLIENLVQAAAEYENNCDRLVAKTIRVHLEKAKQAIRDAVIPTPAQASGWQPIKTFPENGEEYLACNDLVAGGFYQVVYWDEGTLCVPDANIRYGKFSFTHWMDLALTPADTKHITALSSTHQLPESCGGGESRPAPIGPQASAQRRSKELTGEAGVATSPQDALSVPSPEGK